MEYIRVTKENIDTEHVCCAISNNKDCQVMAKKSWLTRRFDDGLVFLKGDVRGKFFIEYLPAEKAWAPIDAAGYMYIDCFWIAGQFKGNGYSNELLEQCISDSRARGMKGLCCLSSQKKKMPFMSDPKYLTHKGFKVADTARPFFSLMYLPFDETLPAPCFKPCAKEPLVTEPGYVIYYADRCPYTAKYVPLLEETARAKGIALKTIHIETTEQAQSAPSPFTSFSLFRDGEFVTNEVLNEKRFLALAGIE